MVSERASERAPQPQRNCTATPARLTSDPLTSPPPAEALNQGDTVDLDALMADLCSIEQELSTISKPNTVSRGQSKGQQRGPVGRGASTKHVVTGGGGSSGGSQQPLFVCF